MKCTLRAPIVRGNEDGQLLVAREGINRPWLVEWHRPQGLPAGTFTAHSPVATIGSLQALSR